MSYLIPHFEPDDFDFFRTPFEKTFSSLKNHAKTDIIEYDDKTEMVIDLPGVKKENVKVTIEKGTLTISASNESESEQKDSEGKYIRRERVSGSYTRSFNIDENITKSDIKAKLDNGVLTVTIPKKDKSESGPESVDIE